MRKYRKLSHIASPVESGSYPRIYRASATWLVTLVLCGMLLALGGLFGAWFLAHDQIIDPHSRVWLVALMLAFAVLGVYCILSTLRSRVMLFPDRIEVQELTGTIVMYRENIRGWRALPTSPCQFVFVSKDQRDRAVKVTQVFPLDREFAQWVYTLPSLDDIDRRASKAEIRNNPSLGATPGERMDRLRKGKRFATALTVISSLASLRGFLYPHPYGLVVVVLAALPWIGLEIVRRSHGLFQIDGPPRDPHPNVAMAFLFPTMILALRSVADYNVLWTPAAALFSVGIGALLCISVVLLDPSARKKAITVAAFIAFCLAYGFGVAVQANALLDRSPEATYVAHVQGKRIARGKTTSYIVDLAPWGPIAQTNELQVNAVAYRYIQRGDAVDLVVRKGALGFGWYSCGTGAVEIKLPQSSRSANCSKAPASAYRARTCFNPGT